MRRSGHSAAAICVAVALLSLIACSSSQQDVGTLTGHLRQVGGPPPGVDRPVGGTVTITSPDKAMTISVGSDGVFRVDLPAGTYTVVGHSPSTLSGDKEADCPATSPAVVAAGRTNSSDAICSIR